MYLAATVPGTWVMTARTSGSSDWCAAVAVVRSPAFTASTITRYGPEDAEAAMIEDELALVGDIPGLDLSNFRPDRNAAAGGALPKVAGTTR